MSVVRGKNRKCKERDCRFDEYVQEITPRVHLLFQSFPWRLFLPCSTISLFLSDGLVVVGCRIVGLYTVEVYVGTK